MTHISKEEAVALAKESFSCFYTNLPVAEWKIEALCNAAIEHYLAKREPLNDELLQVAVAFREWIDAVPKDTELPAMPGVDRDLADTVILKAQKAYGIGVKP